MVRRTGQVAAWLLILTVVAGGAFAGEAHLVPPEALAAIVDDDPDPLPRSPAPFEVGLPLPEPDLSRLPDPPAGLVDTPAEFERNEGLLIRWGYFNSVLTAMTVGITTGDEEAVVHVLVTGASQQASATSTLQNAGADLSQVQFITYTTDSVWIRDYGPRFIREGDQRAIVDHVYNRARPLDDAFPDFLATLWGEPQYDLPLRHGGGNFHLFADGEAFMTELVLDENPALTAQQVEDLYAGYQGLDLTITDALPTWFDSTRHIDMWMMPVSDRQVIIGEYAAGTAANTVTEAWVAELQSRGYTVLRTPGWSAGGTHYTYTNAVVFNDLVFVPEYTGYATENAQAMAVFQAAFPDHQLIPVNCSEIIVYAGAIHCVVMHVPEVLPLPFFADDFESGTPAGWSAVVP